MTLNTTRKGRKKKRKFFFGGRQTGQYQDGSGATHTSDQWSCYCILFAVALDPRRAERLCVLAKCRVEHNRDTVRSQVEYLHVYDDVHLLLILLLLLYDIKYVAAC